jgi:hypothetical protein
MTFLTAQRSGLLAPFALSWSPDGRTLAVLGSRLSAPTGGKQAGQVVFIDVGTGKEVLAVDGGPPLIGVGVTWMDERWLVASMLDRSSAPMQLWLLSYPDGTFHRLSNDLNQYVGVSLTGRRDALVTTRSEFTFGIWTGDSTGAGLSQLVPDTPMRAIRRSVVMDRPSQPSTTTPVNCSPSTAPGETECCWEEGSARCAASRLTAGTL